jgi:Kyakuja-Dileera-Zisupton transposase
MKGLAATGVGAVDCARHDMKHLLAVGDLLKGEQYSVYKLLIT